MTVSIISLGCAKNLVDSERMLARMEQGGYSLTADPADADIAVINTCGFIQSAKEEAIETILEIGKLKEEGRVKKLILTGCLTERYKEEAANEFPEADAVIGIGDEDASELSKSDSGWEVRAIGDFSGDRAAIVSLNIRDLDSGEVSDALSEDYGIATRPGAHCAPRLHTSLGTKEQGTVRFSFSPFTTFHQTSQAAETVRRLLGR